MKTIITIFITVLLTSMGVKAQEYRIATTNTKDNKLILEDFIGDFQAEGYDGKEIVFSKIPFDKNNASATTPNTATDNSGLGLHVEKNGNEITVTCVLTNVRTSKYKVKIPNNFSIRINTDCERSREIAISNMNNEVEISNCQSIKLSNITGSLILSTTSGNIDIENCSLDEDATISIAAISGNIHAVMNTVNTKAPVLLNSISGNVDLTLPKKLSGNFTLKSISGTLKSDFDFPGESKKTNMIGNQIEYHTSTSEVKIIISTVSGNITVRKGK